MYYVPVIMIKVIKTVVVILLLQATVEVMNGSKWQTWSIDIKRIEEASMRCYSPFHLDSIWMVSYLYDDNDDDDNDDDSGVYTDDLNDYDDDAMTITLVM